MNTSREYKGIFWIPGEQDNWKNGILKFLDGIAYVDLFGSFDKDPFNNRSKRRKNICCIHGRLDNQQYCILNNCDLRITSPFFVTTLINFEYLYFASTDKLVLESISFDKIEFELDFLKEWVNYNAFETFWNDDNKIEGVKRKNQKLKNSELFTNSKFQLGINHYTSIPIVNPKKDYTLEQGTSLVLEIKCDIETSELFKFIDKIQDLFILMIGDKVSLNRQVQFFDTKQNNISCHKNDTRFRNTRRLNDKWNAHNMLFNLEEVCKYVDVKNLFNIWFTLYEDYDYPIELLIKSISDISMNQENRFMNLMYALDVIQLKDITNTIKKTRSISKKEIGLLKTLKNKFNVDGNTLQSLETQLEKKKNSKLKEKIKKLIEPYSSSIESLFKENFNEFITLIINTRNFLSHENSSEPRLSQNQFQNYNFKLEAILILLFFTKLKIPQLEIESKIKRHDRFNRIIKE